MTLAENINITFNYISTHFLETFVFAFIVFIIIWALFNRELFVQKVQNEQISFMAMVFGIVLALANFVAQPKPLSFARLSVTGDELIITAISIISIIAIFILVSALIFIYPRGE